MARALTSPFLLIFFLFIKRGEKIEYWSLCLKLWVTTLSLWWYRGRLTLFALCSCIKYRDVLQTFRAQGIHCLVGGYFFVLVPFCLWLFYGKRFAMKLPCNIWRERTLFLEVKFYFLCINKHWKFITVEVVRGKIKLLYDF